MDGVWIGRRVIWIVEGRVRLDMRCGKGGGMEWMACAMDRRGKCPDVNAPLRRQGVLSIRHGLWTLHGLAGRGYGHSTDEHIWKGDVQKVGVLIC